MKNPNTLTVSLVTIGDELLIGQTIDTNSAWMAKELNHIGASVRRRVAVGDNWDDIWNCLEKEGEAADVVLITGGLGPTSDDITKPLLCKFFGGKMITDKTALENVIDIFTKKLNRPLLDRNLWQADVPDNCIVLQNKRGTAPGMWFEKNNTIYVSMPGVPHEMKGMMQDDVLPILKDRFMLHAIQHRTLLTAGIGESFLAEILIEFEQELPPQIKLAYLPSYGMVRLRLTTSTQHAAHGEIDVVFDTLKKLVGDYLVIDQDLSLQEAVSNILKSRKKTLSIAESCTGGYLSHLITLIPGSSSFFLGSVVSYSNEMKVEILDVPSEIINQFGAVSLETVAKMAEGIRKKTGSDYALATSGIMGPEGETNQKTLGHVCVAVSSAQTTITTTFDFRFDRKRNIELTAVHALNFLRKNIG